MPQSQTAEELTIPRRRGIEYLQVRTMIEPRHRISNNVVCATKKASDQPAHTRCLIRALACRFDIL